MAGHNKWSKIKHKKGAADSKRAKVWTKIIREITVATRLGGPDADGNPRLRKAVDDAKAANMTKDTVDRAISRGAGDDDTEDYEELVYEGYGPAGVALYVECTTDNRNRTGADIRVAFKKNGGNLGALGSVGYLFDKKGHFVFEKEPDEGKAPTEDALFEVGMEHGAEDVIDEDDVWEVVCLPNDFQDLREAFVEAGFSPTAAQVAMLPQTTAKVAGGDVNMLLKLVDALEDLDDVQHVWGNFDIDPDELEAALG
ncbi:MAG: YebC/PmpR family DNA-binding transcriptional regulator [Deltaproteobacteria bacterium]|nr:YebC/PmpR family DNA-binding transcriptional regulator [Deltaproteobacteria bacterium]